MRLTALASEMRVRSENVLVFLSHASADKPTARRLRDALIERGPRVWLDEIDIRVGQSIPDEVGSGIDSADALCLLVSSASEQSRWVSREANAFLVRMLKSDGVILPCRLDDTMPPALLTDIKYADFRGSFDEGLSALLAAIRVKEAIDEAEEIEDATRLLRRELNRDELAFFVAYFRDSDQFYVADRRESRAPHRLLDVLADAGVVDREADRWEVQWDLNDRGKEILERVREDVTPSELERLSAWIARERM